WSSSANSFSSTSSTASGRNGRIDATPELLRSNLILELGLAEEQFEILDTVQELLSDGSFAPSTELPSMSIGGPQQEP
ncbi:hypothetical protein AB2C89_33185, partial [Pseudomonas aeruginosa]